MVLSNLVGERINEELLNNLKQDMFLRSDGLYYLVDEIASEDDLGQIKSSIEDYLENFGCFEVAAMWEYYKPIINDRIIMSKNHFGELAIFLMNNECHIRDYYNISFVKKPRVGFPPSFKKCISKIETVVCEEYCGTMPDESISAEFYGFSIKNLQKIIKDFSDTLYFTEINGSECIQHIDNLGLPEDLSDTISNSVEKLESIGIPLTLEAIHTAISLDLGFSFRDEYGIIDDATLKMIIQRHCNLVPKHMWDHSILREVHE
ncbi:hypothetical protein MMALV_06900 [Candidatus Methanomethylophilus alvi Mx1201]|uniref:Uncharacterized protein n=2 Tax=Methanomethylophilus alvi TaxID=1291540 RepID=M9SCF7_METAX|nr:hypothetical protein MMALV_06900 [Candidatus Methanomethylophilus alvi Mx1201]AYQ54848.1 hypothetical protein BKD89_03380 [Methanomethylophilus alvi]